MNISLKFALAEVEPASRLLSTDLLNPAHTFPPPSIFMFTSTVSLDLNDRHSSNYRTVIAAQYIAFHRTSVIGLRARFVTYRA